ncbi:chemotaxis protein CheW [Azohydromonas caseinilytica]|uniref:Chemotaxis protein CheW n=1 Tax=Azohydromonas caseinilytica TaxID=2728836 RepID=A0A848FA00_9BURK|nr:chemotaxis protein CheW [Azohydromonas caseinilytica]NML15153.1 chemotaxis protein CheW [Azohydromonas caseinilytica]
MARKDALKELQARLAQRLQEVPAGEAPAWLAVECAGARLLLPLQEAGEIVEHAPPLLPLPHAQPWFEGVLNLRGHLHGVVDLAVFLGLRPPGAPHSPASRLVALNPALGLHCALRVDRLAGLRSAAQLVPLPTPPVNGADAAALGGIPAGTAAGAPAGDAPASRPAFAGELYGDNQGRTWQALRLAALARDTHFLHVAQPLPGTA